MRLVVKTVQPCGILAPVLVQKSRIADMGMVSVPLGAAPDDGQHRLAPGDAQVFQRLDRDIAAFPLPIDADEKKVQSVKRRLLRRSLANGLHIDTERQGLAPKPGQAQVAGRPFGHFVRGIDHPVDPGREAGFAGIRLVGNPPAIGLAQKGRGGIGDMKKRQIGAIAPKRLQKRAGHQPDHGIKPGKVERLGRKRRRGFSQDPVAQSARFVPQNPYVERGALQKPLQGEIGRAGEIAPVIGVVRCQKPQLQRAGKGNIGNSAVNVHRSSVIPHTPVPDIPIMVTEGLTRALAVAYLPLGPHAQLIGWQGFRA